jgi:hypothetical protein
LEAKNNKVDCRKQQFIRPNWETDIRHVLLPGQNLPILAKKYLAHSGKPLLQLVLLKFSVVQLTVASLEHGDRSIAVLRVYKRIEDTSSLLLALLH